MAQNAREPREGRLLEQHHAAGEPKPQRRDRIGVGGPSMDHDHRSSDRLQRFQYRSKPLRRPLLCSSTSAWVDDEHRRTAVPAGTLELTSSSVGD